MDVYCPLNGVKVEDTIGDFRKGMMLDPEMLRTYRRRWQAVAEIETYEERESSVTERWRRLNALLRMAAALRLDYDDPAEALAFRQWNRLRAMYQARVEKVP